MRGLLLILVPIVFGMFDLEVKWVASNHDRINITLHGQDQFITQCVQSGLEVRYRFMLRLCRRRTLWFDNCEAERIDTHAVQYDPISETYSLVMDTHHDVEGPRKTVLTSAEEALGMASSIRGISLSQLPMSHGHHPDAQDSYVGVRVISECKGEGNGVLAQIPRILSFGMFNPSVSDSGWVAFDVGSGKTLPH